MSNENRFKKGIQKAEDNTSDNMKINKQDNAKETILSNAFDNIKESTLSNTRNSILDDILKSSKKDRGRNYTLYLSADVGDALESQVKKSEMTRSELVDKILRKVLLDK